MKKAILAPLCSGLVIPGLGQVINHDLKKGVTLLGTAFALLLIAAVKFFQVLKSVLESIQADPSNQTLLVDQLKAQDLSVITWVSGAFFLIWAYSVVDAFWKGLKADRTGGGGK